MRRTLAVVTVGLTLFAVVACGEPGAEPDTTGDGGTVAPDATGGGGQDSGQNGSDGPDGLDGLDEATSAACGEVDAAFSRLDSEEGQAVSDTLFDAAESEDPEELAQAEADYLELAEDVAQDLGAAAETADDPEMSAAVEVLADEFATASAEVAADPAEADQVDMTGFQTALQDVGVWCEPEGILPTG